MAKKQREHIDIYRCKFGIIFWLLKDQKVLVSSTSNTTNRIGGQYYNQFVPGVVGNPEEPTDTAFGGIGWKYVENPNYIPYVSKDYDENEVDISGNNFQIGP